MIWDTIKVDEVCLQSMRSIPGDSSNKQFLKIGSSPVDSNQKIIINTQNFSDSEAPFRAHIEIREGDVLVSTVYPTLNSVEMVPSELDGQFVSTDFCVLRPNDSIIEKKFLYYYAKTSRFALALNSKAQGAEAQVVSETDVKEIDLPLLGLSEQRKIVQILDGAESLRARCAKAIDRNTRILIALYYKNFGDPVTNQKRWPTKLLGEVTKTKPQFGVYSRAIEWTEGLPRLLRPKDITDDGNLRNTGVVTGDLDNWAQYQLSAGDILFAWSGNNVGKSYLYRPRDGLCVYSRHLIRYRVDQSQVLPWYLFAFAKTEFFKNWVEVRKIESSVPTINGLEFSSLPIPCPPMSLQEGFVKSLELLFCIREKQQSMKDKVDCLFDVLLHLAFSGDLTAKWRETRMRDLNIEIKNQVKTLENQSSVARILS